MHQCNNDLVVQVLRITVTVETQYQSISVECIVPRLIGDSDLGRRENDHDPGRRTGSKPLSSSLISMLQPPTPTGGARWRSQLRGREGGTSRGPTTGKVSINTGLRERLFNSALGFSSTRRPLVREVRLSDEACDFRRSAHPDTLGYGSTCRPSWARPRRADGSPEASGLLVGPMGEGYGHVRHL